MQTRGTSILYPTIQLVWHTFELGPASPWIQLEQELDEEFTTTDVEVEVQACQELPVTLGDSLPSADEEEAEVTCALVRSMAMPGWRHGRLGTTWCSGLQRLVQFYVTFAARNGSHQTQHRKRVVHPALVPSLSRVYNLRTVWHQAAHAGGWQTRML